MPELKLKLRTTKEGGWSHVDHFLYDIICSTKKGTKPYLIAVYVYLCRCAGEDQGCWPSQEDIAKKTGMSVRKVKGVIKELAIKRLIYIEKRRKGLKTKNRYYLLHRTMWITGALYALTPVHRTPPKETNIKKKEIKELRKNLTTKMRAP